MSDNRPPYHRRTTRPLPKPELPTPPASAAALEQDSVETCRVCPWCRGNGMVPASKVDEWRAAYAEVGDKEPIVP